MMSACAYPPHEPQPRDTLPSDADPRPESAPDSDDDYGIVPVPRSNTTAKELLAQQNCQYSPPLQELKGVHMWNPNAASLNKTNDEVSSVVARPGAFAVQLAAPCRSATPSLSHQHVMACYNKSGGEPSYLTVPTYPSSSSSGEDNNKNNDDKDQEVGTWETSFWTTAELVDEEELRRQVLADTPAVHATLWKDHAHGDDVEVSFLMAYRAKQQRVQRRWFCLTVACCVGLMVLVVVLVARGDHFVAATTTTTQAANNDYDTVTSSAATAP